MILLLVPSSSVLVGNEDSSTGVDIELATSAARGEGLARASDIANAAGAVEQVRRAWEDAAVSYLGRSSRRERAQRLLLWRLRPDASDAAEIKILELEREWSRPRDVEVDCRSQVSRVPAGMPRRQPQPPPASLLGRCSEVLRYYGERPCA